MKMKGFAVRGSRSSVVVCVSSMRCGVVYAVEVVVRGLWCCAVRSRSLVGAGVVAERVLTARMVDVVHLDGRSAGGVGGIPRIRLYQESEIVMSLYLMCLDLCTSKSGSILLDQHRLGRPEQRITPHLQDECILPLPTLLTL